MNVAIVGATGYGGIQAVNLLKKNKKYKISFLGGNKTSGSKWNDNFPFIYLDNDPYIEEISVDNISKNSDEVVYNLIIMYYSDGYSGSSCGVLGVYRQFKLQYGVS